MSPLRIALNQWAVWILGDVRSICPVIYSDVTGIEVREAVLLTVLAYIRVGLSHFGHGVFNYLRIPFLEETLLFPLTCRLFNITGERYERRIRMAVRAHHNVFLETTPKFVRIHQRPEMGNRLSAVTYRNHRLIPRELQERQIFRLFYGQLSADFEWFDFWHLYLLALSGKPAAVCLYLYVLLPR